jgi:hypothetical protein
MSIPKTGSRKIRVNGEEFRWRITRFQKTSDWRSGEGVMSEDYMRHARYYGLGDIKDIVFRIPVELYEKPVSKVLINYRGLLVDGFHGPEQLVTVKPKLIAWVINKCLENGWDPHKKPDLHVMILENEKQAEPGVLVFEAKSKGKKKNEELVFKIEAQ